MKHHVRLSAAGSYDDLMEQREWKLKMLTTDEYNEWSRQLGYAIGWWGVSWGLEPWQLMQIAVDLQMDPDYLWQRYT